MAVSIHENSTSSKPVSAVPYPDRNRFASAWPAPLTSFLGRNQEVAAIGRLLRREDVRLVTLTGPGGVGKTRLALEVLAEVAGDFADGARFVALAGVREPHLVLPAIAEALGICEEGNLALAERVRAILAPRELIILLDNVEQVVTASPLLADLLAACPRLTLFATSRVPLRLSAERQIPVLPLNLPDRDGRMSVELVAASAAVQLFVARAQAVKPDFTLTEANAPAIAAICRAVDGLPLAIELAAARTKVLSPPALLARLSDRLRPLTGGPREVPDRLRTMRDAIAWSYNLVGADEQSVFARLAVFVGGCTLEAADAVAFAGGNLEVDGLELLSSLVDHNLLRVEEDVAGEARFSMLETIRAYGLEQLAARGEEAEARNAHAAYFAALAERAEPELSGTGGPAWLDRLEADHTNLRAALAWSTEWGCLETAWRIAAALGWFWHVHGHLSEGRYWLDRLLESEPQHPVETHVRAKALHGAGTLAWAQGDSARARALHLESLEIWQAIGDKGWVARAQLALAMDAWRLGDDDLTTHAELALVAARTVGDDTVTGRALIISAIAAARQCAFADARSLLDEALTLCRASGHLRGLHWALITLAELLNANGQSREVASALGGSLVTCRDSADEWGQFEGLARLAALAADHGHLETAARCFGAAERMRIALGVTPFAGQVTYQSAIDAVRLRLGKEQFAAAWRAGEALPAETVVAEAIALAGELANPTTTNLTSAEVDGMPPLPVLSDAASRFGLTRREVEVLRLIAEHHTDREIAVALFLSARTVGWHVTHILQKLTVGSRREAAALARREHLV